LVAVLLEAALAAAAAGFLVSIGVQSAVRISLNLFFLQLMLLLFLLLFKVELHSKFSFFAFIKKLSGVKDSLGLIGFGEGDIRLEAHEKELNEEFRIEEGFVVVLSLVPIKLDSLLRFNIYFVILLFSYLVILLFSFRR
jgi:hypothetical protein